MQKNRILTAILCGAMLISLAGCGNQEQTVSVEAEAKAQTALADVTSAIESSDDITAGRIQIAAEAESDTAEETSAKQEETSSGEQERVEAPISGSGSAPESTQPAETDQPVQPAVSKPAESVSQPEPTKPAETAVPAETKTPAEQPKQEESPQTSEPVQPAESTSPAEPPKQEESPPPAESSEPTEPEFDINYWISYAKSYAQSVGLILESSAVDCWDNPIGANAQCIYLERDIQSRLNRYAKDDEITDVWIWAESLGGGSYNLYIGYA